MADHDHGVGDEKSVELRSAATAAEVAEFIRFNSAEPALAQQRADLGRFAAGVFGSVGRELHVAGNVFGSDRVEGRSPWGHGTDETVGMSMILRIASQLVSASVDLFVDRRTYATAALTRQLVEVEYLAWASRRATRMPLDGYEAIEPSAGSSSLR
jgi:hypothetical protein